MRLAPRPLIKSHIFQSNNLAYFSQILDMLINNKGHCNCKISNISSARRINTSPALSSDIILTDAAGLRTRSGDVIESRGRNMMTAVKIPLETLKQASEKSLQDFKIKRKMDVPEYKYTLRSVP